MPAEGLSLSDCVLTHSLARFLIFGARDARRIVVEAYRTLGVGSVVVMTTRARISHSQALNGTRDQLYGEHGVSHIKLEWLHHSHLEELLKGMGFRQVEAMQVESGMENMKIWMRGYGVELYGNSRGRMDAERGDKVGKGYHVVQAGVH